jgi:16S rRNA (guanine527-N7)-methyltransferase
VTAEVDREAAGKLEEVLARSRELGFLGPGPVQDHIDHAAGFVEALATLGAGGPGARIADLGAGGGVPGLPLLVRCPDLRMVLVDASQRRCSFLVWAVVELGGAERAEVRLARAEELAHEREHRGAYDAVIARGFGSPSTTVECGAPLLRPGGRLAISEPPGGRRWPEAGLDRAGLREVGRTSGVVVFERTGSVPAELPRPSSVQRRRPLFSL